MRVGVAFSRPLHVPNLAPRITAFDDPALLELWIAALDDFMTTGEVRELLHTRIARRLPDYWLRDERPLPSVLVDALADEAHRIVSNREAELRSSDNDEITRQLRAVCTPTESAFLTALAVSLHADPNRGIPLNGDLWGALEKTRTVPVQGNARGGGRCAATAGAPSMTLFRGGRGSHGRRNDWNWGEMALARDKLHR